MTESLRAVCPHCSAVSRIPADRLASEASCGVCKARLFTGEPIVLTSKTFDKHGESVDTPFSAAAPEANVAVHGPPDNDDRAP